MDPGLNLSPLLISYGDSPVTSLLDRASPPRISGSLGETGMTLLYESTGREPTGQG